MKRNFETWLSTMKDSIASWDYYVDFKKINEKMNSYRKYISLFNTLFESKDLYRDFAKIIKENPHSLSLIPVLLAKREEQIKIVDTGTEIVYNFSKPTQTIEEYLTFMESTGLFNIFRDKSIKDLYGYIYGIEVGMDTNSRKNRTGHLMENLVESYLVDYGFVKGKDYFKEMKLSDVERKFNIDLSSISNKGKTEKRFDFVIVKNNHVYASECNFYSSSGSKLNETARSYKNIALEAKNIDNFSFVWFTDGTGREDAKHNLEETFDVLDTLYNINDLNNGILNKF